MTLSARRKYAYDNDDVDFEMSRIVSFVLVASAVLLDHRVTAFTITGHGRCYRSEGLTLRAPAASNEDDAARARANMHTHTLSRRTVLQQPLTCSQMMRRIQRLQDKHLFRLGYTDIYLIFLF